MMKQTAGMPCAIGGRVPIIGCRCTFDQPGSYIAQSLAAKSRIRKTMGSLVRAIIFGAILELATLAPAVAAEPSIADDYARAARVLDGNLASAILNPAVVPHWIDGSAAFWYRRDTKTGPEYLIADAATGHRRLAFDAARLRSAVSEPLPDALPVTDIRNNGAELTLVDAVIRCDTITYRCKTERLTSHDPGTSWSSNRKAGVFVRDSNLWLRRAGTDTPIQLTTDGIAHFAYGDLPGTSLIAVPLARSASPRPPQGIAWAPDGKYFVSTRYDERKVRPYPIVEWVPQDGSFRPKDWAPRIPLIGDEERGEIEVAIFNVESGRKTLASLPRGWSFVTPSFAWSDDDRHMYGLAFSQFGDRRALTDTDVVTGKVRMVIEEASLHRSRFNAFVYNPANVRILEQSREVLWFSERDGWGQIYLYDLDSGQIKRKVTAGHRTVLDLLAVDQRRRKLFFTANGTDQSVDPYNVKIFSVSLDGGHEELLTPEEAVHVASRAPIGNGAQGTSATAALSPDGHWLVESFSSLDQPPVNVIRSASDGHLISIFERADVSAVEAAGWRKPTRVRTLSADGKTALWGTIYFPREMTPNRKYPVIDATYGGPQTINAPADYVNAVASNNPRSRASLAELGFIVVTIDGRGTPGRSEVFNALSYEDFAEPELADHVAGIKQLAARFGNFDLDRVGVYGHSFGGYVSARAMLTYGDFYKVAVSSAGFHSFQSFYPLDTYFPVPNYGRGRAVALATNAVPENLAKLDNMHLAGRLSGKLLLVYGDLDENAPPASTFQLIDAFIKADKPYDLLYLPNQTHNFYRSDAYYTQRMWDYFVQNLAGKSPPRDFKLTLPIVMRSNAY